MRLAISVAVGTALHIVFFFAGGLCVHTVGGKPSSTFPWIIGMFYVPFAVSGFLLGRTRGIQLPIHTAAVSSVLAAVVVVVGNGFEGMPMMLVGFVPAVAFSVAFSFLSVGFLSHFLSCRSPHRSIHT